MVTVAPNYGQRAPIWPLIIAPVACFVYYFIFRVAFLHSIDDAIRMPSTDEASAINEFTEQNWGGHWFYRCAAEYICVTLAAFVAGGLARGRVKCAAIIGSLATSLIFLARFGCRIRDTGRSNFALR
jgi:hypothetical protein